MLNSLYIKNYRNLEELKINSLGRVNLITGKNNTGKSSLLEAIAIYASKGDYLILTQLLAERGENYNRNDEKDNRLTLNIKTFSSLFTNRKINFNTNDNILIGELNNNLSDNQYISIKFIKYLIENEQNEQNFISTKRREIFDNEDNTDNMDNLKIGLKIGNLKIIVSLN